MVFRTFPNTTKSTQIFNYINLTDLHPNNVISSHVVFEFGCKNSNMGATLNMGAKLDHSTLHNKPC
jgi:hypothetical protein